MNVVSMVLVTALSGGMNAPPASAPAAPVASAPVASAPVPATPGCCGTKGVVIGGGAVSDCGCSDRPGLFDRLRGLFARKNNCGCDPCTPAPAPCCKAPAPAPCCKAPAPAPAPCCQTHKPAPCGCAPTAGACDPCSGHGRVSLLDRLRNSFRLGRKNSCQPECGCGSSVIAPATPMPPAAAPAKGGSVYHGAPAAGEKPTELKKLPGSPSPDTKGGEEPKGKSLGGIPVIPEITPAASRTESGSKSPF